MSHRAQTAKSVAGTKNPSEVLFEDYLKQQGVEFEHERIIPGKRKRPDYPITWNGHELIFEVKELYATAPYPEGATDVDPYRAIRRVIQETKNRKQFKEYEDFYCVLVVYNVDDWEFQDWPAFVFGAILGDLGLQMPFDPQRGVALLSEARSVFLGRGKMVDPKSKSAQNTTISAIAVLNEVPIPNPQFWSEHRKRVSMLEAERGRESTVDERFEVGFTMLEEDIPTQLGN